MPRILFAVVVVACAALGGCATTPEAEANNDPFEPMNRVMFDINHKVTRYVAVPVGEAYIAVVPKPVRTGVHNALINLALPVTFANDILQGEPDRALQALARFSVNSTIGLGGFFDPATPAGLPAHTEDLGQTLGVYGVPDGPYLVVPLIGPTGPRDLAGGFGSAYLDPLFYLDFEGRHALLVARHLTGLIDGTSRSVNEIKQLDKTADPYAAMRSAYRQRRAADIRNGDPDTANLPEITPQLILDGNRE